MKMKNKFYVFKYLQLLYVLINMSIAAFDINYLVKYEKFCHMEQDRLKFILGTSITQCVRECGARQHCQALNFWSKFNLCELFPTPKQGQQRSGSCVYVEKKDTLCQSECEYGKTCERSDTRGEGCKVKECINATIIENGTVLGNYRDVRAMIRYKCDYGYKINGSATSQCLDDGKWSTDSQCFQAGIFEPDFVSPWYDMNVMVEDATRFSVNHELGETPLLVDVQVKVTSGDNAGYIFPGTGCPTRDDDKPEPYAGIAYIYNDEEIRVSSPNKNNGYFGRCVYTGTSPYWDGPYSTDSFTAQVRVRAWKKSAFPVPSYSETGIPITGGNSTGSYTEWAHGIGDYPTLVISRTKFPSSASKYPGYYSDSIGAAFVMYDRNIGVNTTRGSSYVIYGYNTSTIRAWAPSVAGQGIFDGTDGWNFGWNRIHSGELEFYAWDKTLLSPTETGSLTLGQTVSGSKLEQGFSSIGDVDRTFTRAWVQAMDGSNSGFRFIGSGSLAYDTSIEAAGCTYGGLLYAYGEGSIRFWQPGTGTGTSNGALICIPDIMGGGINVQASSDGQAMFSLWKLMGRK